MRNGAFYFVFLALLVLVQPFAAQAASWPALPAACMPDRAVKWDHTKSESLQGACHCPPPSACPTNYNQISDPNLAKLPPAMVARCCPQINCPAGSQLEGQNPADTDCNPYCAAGTVHAGRHKNEIGGLKNCDARTAAPGSCEIGCGEPVPNGWRWCVQGGGIEGSGSQIMSCQNGRVVARGKTGRNVSCPPAWEDMCPNPSISRFCPEGSELAGQPLPDDGECNPSACPMSQYDSIMSETGALHGAFSLQSRPVEQLPANLISTASLATFTRDAQGNYMRKIIGQAGPYSDGMGIFAYYYRASDLAAAGLTPETRAFANVCGAGGDTIGCDPRSVSSGNCRILSPQMMGPFGTYIGIKTTTVRGKQCNYYTCGFSATGRTVTSCVTAEARISMADGSTKPAAELKVGDKVKSSNGGQAIVATNRYEQQDRVFYSINGGAPLITDFHPIKTSKGWKVIDRTFAAELARLPGYAKDALTIGDEIVTDEGTLVVKSLQGNSPVGAAYSYNIKVEGNAGFYANGIEVKGFDKMEMKYE